MADRPILFSAAMVHALLEGRKTQTRRVLNPQPGDDIDNVGDCETIIDMATGQEIRMRFAEGDRLYVREAWHAARSLDRVKPRDIPRDADIEHAATARSYAEIGLKGRQRPGIHMPRWASRLTLTVTDVRVERLNDCSEADAIAEGVERHPDYPNLWRRGPLAGDQNTVDCTGFAKLAYRSIWEAINGADSWAANPWVVAVTFTVEQRNIDA